jgi:hypothetical protein
MPELLARISASSFVTGVILHDDQVIEAAPIVAYVKGRARDRVREHCRVKGRKSQP